MNRNIISTLLLLFVYFFADSPAFAGHSYEEIYYYRDCNEYLRKTCKKLPDTIQLKVSMCEITFKKNKCDERKAKDPDQWKYLNCNPYALCQMAVDTQASSNACFVGLLELPRQIGQGAIDGYKGIREYVSKFDRTEADRLKYMAHKLIERETYTGLSEKVKSQVQSLQQKRIHLEQAWIIIKDYFENEYSDYQCLNSNEKQRLKCAILADVASGVALEKALAKGGILAAKKLAKPVQIAEEVVEARKAESKLSLIAKASDKKRFLVEKYATKNVTSEAENKSWRKFIESPGKNQKAVTIENINLKEMNDVIFKDEQYVTSITNLYKDMQMDKLRALEKEIQKKNPNFKFHYFSDFKTVRVAYDDLPGTDVTKLLNQSLSQTNKEFADLAIKEKLVRETDNPSKWFKASSHKSDDWSNLVSRYSREHPDQFFIDGASDPKFKTWANERFTEAKNLQTTVMNDFRGTDVIVETPNGPSINRDLYEIMRKNKNPEVAKAEVERNFGLQKLSDSQYKELRDYFNRADNFAPGLRNTKREFATLADATNGGISIDMIGLGADHIQATSGLALSKAKNIDELLVSARKNEQILTDDINRRKAVIEAKFKEATGDPKAVVTCSGDGCKAFIPGRSLTKAESDRFVDAVTQGREEGRLRFSEVTKMNDPKMYDYVAKQGEDLEKLVRKKLVGSVEPSRLKGMNFTVKINTTNAETGTASIRASRVNSMSNSAKENERIEQAFREAVKELKMNYEPKL